MKGLDTNVLVRYLIRDDDAEKALADRFVAEALDRGETLFVNQIVLCELVWVLTKAYRFRRTEVSEVLDKILLARQFEVEEKDLAFQALETYAGATADFADCLIGARNRAAGCASTVTFDRAAGSIAPFELLG